MQADLVARLRADATLTGLLGSKGSRSAVDWVSRPDSASLPALTLTEITTTPSYTQGGREAQAETTVQIDAWGKSVLDCTFALSRAIILLEAEATVGSTFFQRAFLTSGPRSMRTEDLPGGQTVNRQTADLTFYHKPA